MQCAFIYSNPIHRSRSRSFCSCSDPIPLAFLQAFECCHCIVFPLPDDLPLLLVDQHGYINGSMRGATLPGASAATSSVVRSVVGS
jgi:hypothetical protein